MQLKIITHLIVLLCFLTSIMGMAIYPGGCYECEEEVWEEVPCDEIPLNSTTILPPLHYYYPTPRTTKTSTTTTEQPPTTTTVLTTTTTPETTTLTPTTTTTVTPIITTTATPTTTPTTTITTTPTTTMITTNTPYPKRTTKAKYDPFKKCYCECKLGCKEFCRKVVVNPEPKKQIVQFSKLTEPVAEGQLQLTHYHQRELITNTAYNKNYGTYSSAFVSQPPITDNNIYSSTESSKYQSTTPTPTTATQTTATPTTATQTTATPTTATPTTATPTTATPTTATPTTATPTTATPTTATPITPTLATPTPNNYEENHGIVNNGNSIIPVAYHDKPDLNLVRPLPYAYADAGFKNINSYPSSQISQIQPQLTPALNNYVKNHGIVNKKISIPSVAYLNKPDLNPVPPISYARANTGYKNINSYPSSQLSQPPPKIDYYTAPNSALYDFPIPFENIYSKVTKTILSPTGSAQISIIPSIPNSNPSYSNRHGNGYSQPLYISPKPVKSSQLETQVSLSNTLNYDDTFDDLIKQFMSQQPSNDASFESYSNPFYSMPFSR